MSELNEMIAVAFVHELPSEKCPFCPPKARAGYTTYAGDDNNSKKLEQIMEQPAKLTSLQGGARPQTGKCDDNGWPLEQFGPPTARKKDQSKSYTFQAHHLISGKQAMEGEDIEKWITASDWNAKDTGYSINNTNNGFWAPSVPKEYVGRWSAKKGVLDDDQRQKLAEAVMADFKAQIHIGPHNIADPDDPTGDKHTSYDQYLKGFLKAISDRIADWVPMCKCQPPPKPPQATFVVHNCLDNLSNHMIKQISSPRTEWKVFLSNYALEYHKPVCQHSARAKL